jgi:hypothetical protein
MADDKDDKHPEWATGLAAAGAVFGTWWLGRKVADKLGDAIGNVFGSGEGDGAIMPYEKAKRIWDSADPWTQLRATPKDRERYAKAWASITLHARMRQGLPVTQHDIEMANLEGQQMFDMSSDGHRFKAAWNKIISGAQRDDADLRRRGMEPPQRVQPDWMVCTRCNAAGTDPTFSRNYLGNYQAFPCTKCGGKGQIHNPAAGQPW